MCFSTSGNYTHVEILTGNSLEKIINYKIPRQESNLRYLRSLVVRAVHWHRTGVAVTSPPPPPNVKNNVIGRAIVCNSQGKEQD